VLRISSEVLLKQDDEIQDSSVVERGVADLAMALLLDAHHLGSVPMNKLHEPAPSLKFHQHAFLSTRLLNQISVAGFHPVTKVDEDRSGRQRNEVRTQDAIRLNRQRTGKVGFVLCKEVAFPNKRLWKRRTHFGNVIRKLPGHPSGVFPYPGVGQSFDGFESTFKQGILVRV
jgi:hypothetical protein